MHEQAAVFRNFVAVAGAPGNGICRRFFECNVDSLDSFVCDLRSIFVPELLHCKAEGKDCIAHVMIELRNNGSSRHCAGIVNLFRAQLNRETNDDGAQGCGQIAEQHMRE